MLQLLKVIVRTAIAMSAISFFTPAVAAEGRWTEGYGQGDLEYFIDQQGTQLHIACPTKDGSVGLSSSVSLKRISGGKEAKKFTITANGMTIEGPFEANSQVGENNFLALLEALRKGNAVIKVDKHTIVFPKSNAAQVLPVYGKKFVCNLQ